MSADSNNDQELWVEGAILVRLWVAQRAQIHRLLLGDILGRAVLDKQRLASPLEDHGLSLWDGIQAELNLGHSHNVLGGSQRRQHTIDNVLAIVCSNRAQACAIEEKHLTNSYAYGFVLILH